VLGRWHSDVVAGQFVFKVSFFLSFCNIYDLGNLLLLKGYFTSGKMIVYLKQVIYVEEM